MISDWTIQHDLQLAHHKTEGFMISKKNNHDLPELFVRNSMCVKLCVWLSSHHHDMSILSQAKPFTLQVHRDGLYQISEGHPKRKGSYLWLWWTADFLRCFHLGREGNQIRVQRQNHQSCSENCCNTLHQSISHDLHQVNPISSELPSRRSVGYQVVQDTVKLEDPDSRMKAEVKISKREISINQWQVRWNRGKKGNWAQRILPNIQRWIGRPQFDLTFHLNQLLMGHSYFRQYLYQINRSTNTRCLYCQHPSGTTEHKVFFCPH